MKAVKVLFVDHEAVLGGAELSMVNLVTALRDENLEIKAAIAGNGEFSDALQKAGVEEIYYLPMDGWRCWENGLVGRLKFFLSMPLFIRNIFLWRKLFKKIKPDIIHFNLTRLVEPVIAAKITGVKSIMHFRELSVQNRNFVGGLPVLYSLMHLADYWVANSTGMAEDIKEHTKTKKIFEVSNGIDVSKYQAESGRNKPSIIPDDKYVIAKIAGLVEWKNHKDFLDVAKEICTRRKDAVFLIVGRGTEKYEKELRDHVRELGIEEHIIFTGFIDDIPSLLSQIDILVHTSTRESFGRIYIEAMAAAKPLVVFRGPTTKDIIEDGITGFVVDPSAKNEMADKIEYLLDNHNIRLGFGVNGKERVAKLFSITQTAQKMNGIYQYILSGSKA